MVNHFPHRDRPVGLQKTENFWTSAATPPSEPQFVRFGFLELCTRARIACSTTVRPAIGNAADADAAADFGL